MHIEDWDISAACDCHPAIGKKTDRVDSAGQRVEVGIGLLVTGLTIPYIDPAKAGEHGEIAPIGTELRSPYLILFPALDFPFLKNNAGPHTKRAFVVRSGQLCHHQLVKPIVNGGLAAIQAKDHAFRIPSVLVVESAREGDRFSG